MRRLVALLVASAAVASLLGGCARGGTYSVTAVFDDAGDLVRDHSVQVADVRVGRVGAIRLTEDFRARVTLHIDDDVRVPRDATAYLRTTSLLGEKFVELRAPDADAPVRGPFLRDGDVVRRAAQAPEIEFVAEQAVAVLGAVTGDDVATLVRTGAEGFGGRGAELRTLVADLAQLSGTLASRTSQITRIIDGIDAATARLATADDDVRRLLEELATTTTVLAENRDRTVRALQQLSRVAAVQNDILARYRSDLDRQIRQVDDILRVAVTQTREVADVVDWLDRFVTNVPKVIPEDFTQVYMWLVPQADDARTNGTGADDGGRAP